MSEPEFCLTSCRHCGQRIEFPSEGLGTSVPCPNCSEETLLEHFSWEPISDEKRSEISAAELKAAMAGVVPRRRISVFYQLGLLLVAIFMVLLPVIYFAFVAGLAYATFWFGVHGVVMFNGFSGGIYVLILKVILYLGLLVAGVVAVFFLCKPILARPSRQAEPMELNPAHHPRLYQFIAHICDLLRVPVPRRVYLDCRLNASAGFRRGWSGFFGNDLAIYLGLPLIAGVNTRQLAGIVAHELGHCTQTFAMRLLFVINRVDGWFVRVVYERDSWDDAFEDWAASIEDWRLSIIVACAGVAIWVSRTVLAVLLHLGQAVSCFLSRQMEFHADASACSITGSAGLESLLLRSREQALIQSLAYDTLDQFWNRRRLLPDSVPDFLEQLEHRLPASFYEQAHLTLLNEAAGWFATHPTAAQRIQKARQQAIAGIFTMEKPARWLFNDFATAAQAITGRYYRQSLRLPVTDRMLKPASEFFANDAPQASSASAQR